MILLSLMAFNTTCASSNAAMSLDATIKKGADFIARILKGGENTVETLNNAGQQITTEAENVVTKFDETGQNLRNNTNKLKKITQRHPQNANNSPYDTRAMINNSRKKSQSNQNQTYNGRPNSIYNSKKNNAHNDQRKNIYNSSQNSTRNSNRYNAHNNKQNNAYDRPNLNTRTANFTTNQQPKKKVVIRQSQPNWNTSRQYNKKSQNSSQSRLTSNKNVINNPRNTYNNGYQKKTIVVKRR